MRTTLLSIRGRRLWLALTIMALLAFAAGCWSTARQVLEPLPDLSGRWLDQNAREYVVQQTGVEVIVSTAAPSWCTSDGVVLQKPESDAPTSTDAWQGILDGDTIHGAFTALCDPSGPAWQGTFVHVEAQVSSAADDIRIARPQVHLTRHRTAP